MWTLEERVARIEKVLGLETPTDLTLAPKYDTIERQQEHEAMARQCEHMTGRQILKLLRYEESDNNEQENK